MKCIGEEAILKLEFHLKLWKYADGILGSFAGPLLIEGHLFYEFPHWIGSNLAVAIHICNLYREMKREKLKASGPPCDRTFDRFCARTFSERTYRLWADS